MSLRISTNLPSIAVQNAMNNNQRQTDRAIKNVATGSRLSDPASDVSGKAISEQMRSELKSMEAAKRNTEDASSFVSIAEGGLNEQSNILLRMRELAIQSASDNYSKGERILMQQEYKEIRDELDRIAKTTRFNSVNLLDGSQKEFDFQVGTRADASSRISFKSDANTTSSNLDIDGSSVEEKNDALDSIRQIDKAMSTLSNVRAKFGAAQSRFDSAGSHLGSQFEKLTEARSRINDADVGKEISDMRRGQILQQYQTALLAQSNEQTGSVLRLIG